MLKKKLKTELFSHNTDFIASAFSYLIINIFIDYCQLHVDAESRAPVSFVES